MRFRLAVVALLLLTSCSMVRAPKDSTILQQIAAAYWQHRLETEVPLQIKFGIPVRHLPNVSHDAARRDATFAQRLLQ